MINLVPSKKRENLFGVGILDAKYPVSPKNGALCPYYARWRGMLARCYDRTYLRKFPTYVGCSVSRSWMLFSNFKRWMEAQQWDGMELDKDIIKPGNKIYSAENCRFVTPKTNLFVSASFSHNSYPVGLSVKRGKYIAQSIIEGKNCYLGAFGSLEDASARYLSVKLNEFERVVLEQTDSRIINGLVLHMERIVREHEDYLTAHNGKRLQSI